MLNKLKQQLMLPQFVNGLVETLLNGLIQRTQGYEPFLRKLNGKIMHLTVTKDDADWIGLYFVFSPQRIDLLADYQGDVDCSVQVLPSLLMNMPSKAKLSQYLNEKSLILQGDLQVLQDFLVLFDYLEKDPAELLSPYLGDVVAQSLVNFTQMLKQQIQQHFQLSQGYWGERLTEEWQLVAPSLAIADFCEQVKTLEKKTTVLQQKIAELAQSKDTYAR